MIFARKRRCPACGEETMRYPPPLGLRGVFKLLAPVAHWRRCHRVVFTMLPDSVAHGVQGQRRTTLGKQCPMCRQSTQRAQTPAALRFRKRLLLGLANYRTCWSCGWSGLALQTPSFYRMSRS